METLEQQLNADVNSVQELLLLEAKQILEKVYSDEEIATLEELAKAGFKNSKEYRTYLDWQKAKKITYYSETYPMHKFITEGAVKKICKKYNLLLADVGDYKSDIPFDNQKAIVNFKVKDTDTQSNSLFSFNFEMLMPRMIWGDRGITFEEQKKDEPETIKVKEVRFVGAKNLKVIAPPSKLKMKGKKVKGHCLIDKDPIVLQPVNDGYLIVTAWGFEAKDPEVQNPRHN